MEDTNSLTFGLTPSRAEQDARIRTQPDFPSQRDLSWTLFMVYACSFLEGADVQLLPASYRALESDLGLSPSTLAAANLFQGITLATFSVFWGVISDNGILAPHQILFGGCTTWGVLTLLTACINDASWMLIIRLFNGIALATLSPTTQALIASIAPPQERGRYFCWIGFSLGTGAMSTAILTTAISNVQVCPGFKGWRIAFILIGVVSIVLGHFVKRFAVLPPELHQWEDKLEKEKMIEDDTPGREPLTLMGEIKTMIRFFEVWSFAVIVMQGTFGCLPWSAMSFGTMYFQYCGVSDTISGCISSLMLLCSSIGVLIGGYVGDFMNRWSRFHGRPFTAQISTAVAVPTSIVFYVLCPRTVESVGHWLLLVMVFGFICTWCEFGVNRPILTEVVSVKHRARILGLMCSISGSAGAMGGPLVALIAEQVFGYKTQHRPISQVPEDIRLHNVNALGSALLVMCAVPWTLCFFFYGALHWTYEADLSKLRRFDVQTPLNARSASEDEDWIHEPPFWVGGSP